MSNDEIGNINFDNYMSSNSHISKQQEILYLQNLVSAYASIGTHPCYSYRKTGAGINNIVRKCRRMIILRIFLSWEILGEALGLEIFEENRA